MPGIGLLKETSLHADLKKYYTHAGDFQEEIVDGYVVDIVRGNELIEIQTRGFASIRKKLAFLLQDHSVRLVYPVAGERWIVRIDNEGVVLSRRKSPRKGRLIDAFDELMRIPAFLGNERFSLDIVLVADEVIWKNDGLGSWRRKRWSIDDRKLLAVKEIFTFQALDDYARLLPANILQPFTVRSLANCLKCSPRLASKMAYCLRQAGLLNKVGKRGPAYLYQVVETVV